jgi:hypothetical protein
MFRVLRPDWIFFRKIIRPLPWILLAIALCINVFGYGNVKIEANGEKCTVSTGPTWQGKA